MARQNQVMLPWGLFVLLCQILVLSAKSTSAVYHLPSSAKTGHVVTVLPTQSGQRSRIVQESGESRRLFALLGRGELVTASGVSSLAGKTTHLTIYHRLRDKEWQQTITISVEESNRDVQFVDQPYKGYVSENKPPGTKVEKLEGLSKNVARLPYECTVQIIKGSTDALQGGFRNSSDAKYVGYEIWTRARLDREQVDAYYLVLEARCPTGTAYAMVKIFVQDLNDNAPTFYQSLYWATASTQEAGGAPLLLIRASDQDEIDDIRYELEDDLFEVNSESGAVMLKSGGTLLPRDLRSAGICNRRCRSQISANTDKNQCQTAKRRRCESVPRR